MFTIKHIHLDGQEDVLDVAAVRYSPAHGPIAGTVIWADKPSMDARDIEIQPSTPTTVWITEAGWAERPLTGGTVFVMNSNGKTVARYDLGASSVPIVGDGLSDPRPKGVGLPQ